MHILVTDTPIAPWELLAEHEKKLKQKNSGQFGACATFIGTMRDFNEGGHVKGMNLEHYPGMTEKHLQSICEEACQRWDLLDTHVTHRVGNLYPDDPIVLVAVWSTHRKDAFEACRYIMEDLKSKAPFWKKELLENDEHRWVEKNTAGY